MIRSALLAALLLAAPAAAERGVVPVGPREGNPPAASYPQDGAFVYSPDPACPTVGRTLPDLPKALCMRAKALEYLIREVAERRVIPGPGFTACQSWADFAFPTCVDWAIRLRTPEIRWGMSPVYLTGHIGGVPWTGCVAGVSYPTFIRVSLADESRIYRLASWETANGIVVYWLDLRESGDGPIVSAATNYAAQACGVQ